MTKVNVIAFLIKIIMWCVLLGTGVWYLSSSLGGASLSYTSLDNFLLSIGVRDGNITSANGCFLCGYINELFNVMGDATVRFWTVLLDNLWVLMVVGFGIYVFISGGQHLFDAAKKASEINNKETKFEFKSWFDQITKQGIRVMVFGAIIGAFGMGGVDALRFVADIVIRPVLYLGAELSMLATGVSDASQCPVLSMPDGNIMSLVSQPFMCVMGNVNSVMLAGAAGGFSLMNYAWLGMGGGFFTWLSGLGLVLMFLIIGFDLVFQVLGVIFKLVFVVIFLPLIMAGAAFEGTWKLAGGLIKKSIDMLVSSAIQMVVISLKVLIIYATVVYSADMFFPAPYDGYTAILPPLVANSSHQITDNQTLSVMTVFSDCEQVSVTDGELDKDKFLNCFTARRAQVERQYPNAFDFLDDGWDFLLLMGFLAGLYFVVLNKRLDALFAQDKDKLFDFGDALRGVANTTIKLPMNLTNMISKQFGKK